MAQRFGVWARLWRSAFSAEAYRDAASGPVGSMVGYLAVLIAVASVVVTLQTHLFIGQTVDATLPHVRERMPEIRITNGAASSPVPQPYVWEGKELVLVVDTTGATTDLDARYGRGLLVTRTELIARRSPVETRRYSLERFEDLVIDAPVVERLMRAAKTWFWLPALLGLNLWLWITKPLQVLLWSLLALIVNAATRKGLSYRALFNLGICALTVSLVFDVLKGPPSGLRPLGLLSLAIYAAYLIFGVLVQPSASSGEQLTVTSQQ